ncbi:hypothetical protein [Aliivibrio sifiae]|uniref:hypothetical protein n=1 Tax=Aliivibrio sifiae TaxID=566293 RepID=UPI003D0AF374
MTKQVITRDEKKLRDVVRKFLHIAYTKKGVFPCTVINNLLNKKSFNNPINIKLTSGHELKVIANLTSFNKLYFTVKISDSINVIEFNYYLTPSAPDYSSSNQNQSCIKITKEVGIVRNIYKVLPEPL